MSFGQTRTQPTTLQTQGPKAVIGHKGFARFLTVQKKSVAINPAAVEADARLDGKFVLRTNTDRPAPEVAQAYKSLWRVERTFREEKSTLEVRPVYHQRDDTTIGHIVACFLPLRLEVDLQRRLDARGITAPWPDLMRDLAQVQAVEVTCDGQRYRLRTDLAGHAAAAFAAVVIGDIAKPMYGMGSGVFEIALPFRGDAFRLVYAVQFGDEIWVVHAFQKKATQGIKTPSNAGRC
jgi:hypothetical protein